MFNHNTTLKPPLKWPGAKWNLADWIVSHFPPHQHYLEPFFGSGAAFFTKAPSLREVVNDLDSNVVNLFRLLRDPVMAQHLAGLVYLTPWSREEYLASYAPTDDSLEQARRFLVRHWQSHGGCGGVVRSTGWRHNGAKITGHSRTTSVWRKLPDRLLATVDRLKDAEIECRPALDVIQCHNSADTLIYADPPYVLSSRRDDLYTHEMSDDDHVALLAALDAHRGPVLLSGYDNPLYAERLAHWLRVERQALAEKGRQRTEVLWLNPVAFACQSQGRMF
jgi:DNA adenine methylase